MGSRELIPWFALLACAAFALPIKLPLPQPTSFLTFALLIHSLIPLGGIDCAAVWGYVLDFLLKTVLITQGCFSYC